MNDFVPIFVVGFAMLCVYKVFELLVRKKERELLIEKLASLGENEEDKERLKIQIPLISSNNSDFWALRISLLTVGIGAGCLLALLIQLFLFQSNPAQSYHDLYNQFENFIILINFACITMFGGIGLLIAFLIEQKKKAKKEK